MKLIDALDEDDDVQTVWGNDKVSDEELEKLLKPLRRGGAGEGMPCPLLRHSSADLSREG